LPQGTEAVETADLAEPLEFLRFAGLALAITQRAVPGANRASRHSNQGLMSWAMSSTPRDPHLPPRYARSANQQPSENRDAGMPAVQKQDEACPKPSGRTQDNPNLVDLSPSSRRGRAAKSMERGEGAQLQGVLLRSGRLRHVHFDHSVSFQELPCDNANRMRSVRRNRSLSCRRKLRRAGSESIEDAPRVRHRREGSAKTRRKVGQGGDSRTTFITELAVLSGSRESPTEALCATSAPTGWAFRRKLQRLLTWI